MLNNPELMACLTELVSVCNAIQTMPLRNFRGRLKTSHVNIFFSFYSQPIPKFNMPFESYENVNSTVHNDLKLKRC